MDIATLPGLGACAFYLTATISVFRGLVGQQHLRKPLILSLGSLALLLHMVSAYTVIFSQAGLNLGISAIASLFGWSAAVLATVFTLYKSTENLIITSYPIAIFGIIVSLFVNVEYVPRQDLPTETVIHILLSILAYSVILIAASQALLVYAQNYQLKHRHLLDIIKVLPPLQTMERILIDIIALGAVLLALAIGSGLLFLDDMFEQRMVHKTLLSIIALITLLTILVGQYCFGWRGITTVRLTLAGFLLLILAYFGSKFVLEILLSG